MDIPNTGTVSIHAGFPNPATDNDRTSHGLSLDQLLLGRPSSTYLFQLSGYGWSAEGIDDGDIAVVDRALGVHTGDLIIAWQGDDFLLLRARDLPKHVAPWGVVSAVVHRYRQE
jgi:SOS-response transcriptional repressor LexA